MSSLHQHSLRHWRCAYRLPCLRRTSTPTRAAARPSKQLTLRRRVSPAFARADRSALAITTAWGTFTTKKTPLPYRSSRTSSRFKILEQQVHSRRTFLSQPSSMWRCLIDGPPNLPVFGCAGRAKQDPRLLQAVGRRQLGRAQVNRTYRRPSSAVLQDGSRRVGLRVRKHMQF